VAGFDFPPTVAHSGTSRSSGSPAPRRSAALGQSAGGRLSSPGRRAALQTTQSDVFACGRRARQWPFSPWTRAPAARSRALEASISPVRAASQPRRSPWSAARRTDGPGFDGLCGPTPRSRTGAGCAGPARCGVALGRSRFPPCFAESPRGAGTPRLTSVYARGAGPSGISLQPRSAAVTPGRPDVLTEAPMPQTSVCDWCPGDGGALPAADHTRFTTARRVSNPSLRRGGTAGLRLVRPPELPRGAAMTSCGRQSSGGSRARSALATRYGGALDGVSRSHLTTARRMSRISPVPPHAPCHRVGSAPCHHPCAGQFGGPPDA
jgi:hypothetical protein